MNKEEEIKILDELRDLIPPLNEEELAQLHREIETDGRANVPLTVWKQENVLVDGHHRYAHCIKHGFPFEVRRKTFTDIIEVKNHMILHQLGRRNLDGKQASILRGELCISRSSSQGGDRKSKPQNEANQKTAKKGEARGGIPPCTFSLSPTAPN